MFIHNIKFRPEPCEVSISFQKLYAVRTTVHLRHEKVCLKKIHTSRKNDANPLIIMAHVIFKLKEKVSRISETHFSMTRMNLWGFGQEISPVLRF